MLTPSQIGALRCHPTSYLRSLTTDFSFFSSLNFSLLCHYSVITLLRFRTSRVPVRPQLGTFRQLNRAEVQTIAAQIALLPRFRGLPE